MLKKYKILLVAIVLTAGGIMLVLGIWLFGSYRGHKQFYLGYTDRELFDVTQDFYQENQQDIDRENQVQRISRLERMTRHLQARYPQINADTVQQILRHQYFNRSTTDNDSLLTQDEKGRARTKRSRHFISSYMFKSIVWTNEVVDSLESRLASAMKIKNRYSPFQLHLVALPNKTDRSKEFYIQRFRDSKTRPILVDPSKNLFLEVDFEDPSAYLLRSIGWQLFFSLVLTLALWGTFFGLLSTIRKQRQLARLRKAFVNNMTHELKTPVSTVMAAIESIQRYGAQDDKEKMDRYLNLSRLELDHLSNMIEKVLQVDIAETNGVQLEKAGFDFDLLIQECTENAQLFSKKKTHITVEKQGDSFRILGDQAHLKNVINNLLDNAIKYAEEPVHIHVLLTESDDLITAQFNDNGIGIPQQYLPGIFDLFFRVPSGNIHNVKGFGLGLAYVRQIVNQHQGRITVQSEEGAGSIFTITLPKEVQ
ncbi:MAG: sensor histidine kinase [Sphingobacterium sp.]